MASTLQKQIIVGALSLIENKENWTRGVLAQTSEGQRCSWSDPRATKFCAIGALGHTAAALVGHYGEGLKLAMEAASMITAANNQPGWCLSSINDTEGQRSSSGCSATLWRKTLKLHLIKRPDIA